MKVNIPDKCLENWNKMTVNEKGRFCQNCQKTVVDFTQMSDIQIKYYFWERQGQKLCGRFKTNQLDKDFSIVPKKQLSILPKIKASALLFTESQIDTNADEQEQNSSIEITKSQKEKSKTIVHGKNASKDNIETLELSEIIIVETFTPKKTKAKQTKPFITMGIVMPPT